MFKPDSIKAIKFELIHYFTIHEGFCYVRYQYNNDGEIYEVFMNVKYTSMEGFIFRVDNSKSKFPPDVSHVKIIDWAKTEASNELSAKRGLKLKEERAWRNLLSLFQTCCGDFELPVASKETVECLGYRQTKNPFLKLKEYCKLFSLAEGKKWDSCDSPLSWIGRKLHHIDLAVLKRDHISIAGVGNVPVDLQIKIRLEYNSTYDRVCATLLKQLPVPELNLNIMEEIVDGEPNVSTIDLLKLLQSAAYIFIPSP